VFSLVVGLRQVGGRRFQLENPRKPAGFGVTRRYGDALGERIEPGQHGRLVALEEVGPQAAEGIRLYPGCVALLAAPVSCDDEEVVAMPPARDGGVGVFP
jgi:hypothetical protein